MSDLIDRQEAIDAIRKDVMGGLNYESILKRLPSADAVEVVRCKDCKYYNPIGVCIEMSSAVCEDSFCCWAERRTDERSDLQTGGD